MLQLHFQGVWTVNGKNTQRQISLHVTSRVSWQAKHRDQRKQGFRLRLTIPLGKPHGKVTPNRPPLLPQNQLHCQTIKISKHQFSAVPHQQCHTAFVGPICLVWSHSRFRQWEGKTTTLKLAAKSPLEHSSSALTCELCTLLHSSQDSLLSKACL